MKALNTKQIIILIILGVITAIYLSASNYRRNNDNPNNTLRSNAINVHVEEAIILNDQTKLSASMSNENIIITRGKGDSFEIVYDNYVLSKKQEKALIEQIIIEDDGKTINIYKKADSSVNINGLNYFLHILDNGFDSTIFNGTLKISVPADFDQGIVTSASSGNITISDMTLTEMKASTSSGNITINSTSSRTANITASSGKITLGGSSDNASISTSSGNINVNDYVTKALKLAASSGAIRFNGSANESKISTSSGNIYFETDLLEGNHDMQASSGNIRITLPKDQAFSIESKTSSGNFKSDINLDYTKKNDDKVIANYMNNNSDALIILSSSSGNQYLSH